MCLYLYSAKANKNPANYFPNATQLTIKHGLEILDDALMEILNRIVPYINLLY
jgi:hypothetical protein